MKDRKPAIPTQSGKKRTVSGDTDRSLSRLVCPRCLSPLSKEGDRLRCTGPRCHDVYTTENGIPFLAPDINIGKYDEAYARRYAGLWAYGYKTMHSGADESLYRTVNELILSNALRNEEYTIVDAGCGVGRVTGDCGRNFKNSMVFGIDASKHMLEWARRINVASEPVEMPLSHFGFGNPTIRGLSLKNVCLVQADVNALPFCEGAVDIGLSINIIDRVGDPRKVISEMYRILRDNGLFVFTSPLDWTDPALWEDYGSAESVLKMFSHAGFKIEDWFDGLQYREILDARGSYQDWNTLVVHARK